MRALSQSSSSGPEPGATGWRWSALLEGLPAEVTAGRCNSLSSAREKVTGFEVTAFSDDVVMAVEDLERRHFAVQFHPESIPTVADGAGHCVIRNVLRLTRRAQAPAGHHHSALHHEAAR
ncbi:glutamine amidotransferase-related protein [Streptomyces sp. NPDC002285]